MRQTVGNALRTPLCSHRPDTLQEAQQMVDTALATAVHALRITYSKTLKASPGPLVFGRDMLLSLPCYADLLTVQSNRQRLIEANLRRQDQRRIGHDYRPNQYVLLVSSDPKKLDDRLIGPHRIDKAHTDGTAAIERHPHILGGVNIKRVRPHRQSSST